VAQLRETRTPCSKIIEEVLAMEQRLAEDADEADGRRVELLHRAATRPFVAAPEHVAAAILIWQSVLAKEGAPPRRFKPVVIDGPTRCGKSAWAEGVFGAARTLMINCQDVHEPPLKHFRKAQYDAIIFEEADWQLVYHNKLLFQAGNKAIDLGKSATNCHHYRKRLFGVAMFILGNEFFAKIEENPAAKEYVDANVEYWKVAPGQFLYA